MTLRKQLKNVKIQIAILYKCLSNQRTTGSGREEVENAKFVIATLNGLLGSWESFIRGMYARRKSLLLVDSGKSTHKNKLDS